jgi:RNA polymerase sigma factor (sigma-70 family)
MNWTGTIENEDNISIQGAEQTNTQRYFKDVGRAYERNGNNYEIEYTPENRDKLIEMNLKCVIKVAKRYLGNGLSLDELICAGNEGLCKAWEKYNPDSSKFRADLLAEIDSMDGEVPIQWIQDRIQPACEYGAPLVKYNKAFTGPKAKEHYPKEWLKNWVEHTIKNASFNSVAMLWVNAYIRQELTNNSRLIRKPVSLIKKEKTGESEKEVIIDINQPISDDGNTTFVDTLYIPDDHKTDMEIEDQYEYLHDVISQLFVGIKLRDRRIVMKRFGIGYLRALQPKEIADMEHISVARVSQIINIAMEKMRENAEELGVKKEDLYRLFEPNED